MLKTTYMDFFYIFYFSKRVLLTLILWKISLNCVELKGQKHCLKMKPYRNTLRLTIYKLCIKSFVILSCHKKLNKWDCKQNKWPQCLKAGSFHCRINVVKSLANGEWNNKETKNNLLVVVWTQKCGETEKIVVSSPDVRQ